MPALGLCARSSPLGHNQPMSDHYIRARLAACLTYSDTGILVTTVLWTLYLLCNQRNNADHAQVNSECVTAFLHATNVRSLLLERSAALSRQSCPACTMPSSAVSVYARSTALAMTTAVLS